MGFIRDSVARLQALHARPRLWGALQVVFALALLGVLAYVVRGVWHDALPRLEGASWTDLAISIALLAAYYLSFVVGWSVILGFWGLRVPYRVALSSEMASMLAKYVPGGVWTPMARIAAMRRAGYRETANVVFLQAMAVEAGLSAVSGVLVFVASLTYVKGVNAPIYPLLGFALVIAALLHPRVFGPLSCRLSRRFAGGDVPPLSWPVMVGLLLYYCLTWLVGGSALLFLLKAVGSSPSWSAVAFLGGVSAVGAIVAVVSILAPSGLGVREGSMYGLLLAVAPEGAALSAVVLNRLTITVVEIALLAAGALLWRRAAERGQRDEAEPEPALEGGDETVASV